MVHRPCEFFCLAMLFCLLLVPPAFLPLAVPAFLPLALDLFVPLAAPMLPLAAGDADGFEMRRGCGGGLWL